MKKSIISTVAAFAMASSAASAGDVNSTKAGIERVVHQYMEGVCEGDISKINDVMYSGTLISMNNADKQISSDCAKSGGISNVKAYINPDQYNAMFLVIGQMEVDIEIGYKNGSTQEARVYIDGGALNNSGKISIYTPPSY